MLASSCVISGIMYRTAAIIGKISPFRTDPVRPVGTYFPDNDRHSIHYPLHMYMCLCVCVCVYVCMYVCMLYTHIHTHTHTRSVDIHYQLLSVWKRAALMMHSVSSRHWSQLSWKVVTGREPWRGWGYLPWELHRSHTHTLTHTGRTHTHTHTHTQVTHTHTLSEMN